MLKASFCKHILKFYRPAITSRDVMLSKKTYFIKIWDDNNPSIYGIGECALFEGLSADDSPNYEAMLSLVCNNINNLDKHCISEYSSIRFGVETAFQDLKNAGRRIIYPSKWASGDDEIKINGLVWMGSFEEMHNRIREKLDSGFHCVKLKIGGIDFDEELSLIKYIRSKFSLDQIELRLDANGAFSPCDALNKLERLSVFSIHSLEQPIKPGQWDAMADICSKSPIPIALDEELIGINSRQDKQNLLNAIKPHYIILKPALCGGFSGADEWISLAEGQSIGWWATSALESNIGLNAIAQWVYTHNINLPQGLGTGKLYSNNIESPLVQTRDVLLYNSDTQWIIPTTLNWEEL